MFASTSKLRFAAIAALAALTIVSGCAKKKTPNSAADIGIGGNAAPGSTQEFTTRVGDRVFFETDSSVLTPTARATLDKQAQWLNRYTSYRIVVEGHSDERGTRAYNIALGARRAAATRNYLAARGVDRSRLKILSYGKERPVAVCDNISCWSQNRRAVTVLNGVNGS